VTIITITTTIITTITTITTTITITTITIITTITTTIITIIMYFLLLASAAIILFSRHVYLLQSSSFCSDHLQARKDISSPLVGYPFFGSPKCNCVGMWFGSHTTWDLMAFHAHSWATENDSHIAIPQHMGCPSHDFSDSAFDCLSAAPL